LKRRVVAETEHIFQEMRAEMERTQFALNSEKRRRARELDALARSVAGVVGGAQAEVLLRQSGIQPEGIGGDEVSNLGGSFGI
jgi:hypothetical protein